MVLRWQLQLQVSHIYQRQEGEHFSLLFLLLSLFKIYKGGETCLKSKSRLLLMPHWLRPALMLLLWLNGNVTLCDFQPLQGEVHCQGRTRVGSSQQQEYLPSSILTVKYIRKLITLTYFSWQHPLFLREFSVFLF